MELTVIIVNWNNCDMLKDCLYSLKQNTDSHNIEIIVVDNASRDGSSKMVETLFPDIHIINSGSNIGFGRANNLAINHAKTKLIFFLNPDTIVRENTLRDMIDFMNSNPQVGALQCKMKYRDGKVQELGIQWFPTPLTELLSTLLISEKTMPIIGRLLPYKDHNTSGYVSKLYGGNLMVRREVIEQVGSFDERFFMYGEDVDLCRRITDAGWKLYYLSTAEIVHLIGGASEKASSNFSALMRCESISKLMQKYYGNTGAISYRIVIFSGSIFRLLISSVLKIVSSLSKTGYDVNYRNTCRKYIAMIKWCLNLQKPEIKV